MTHYTDNYKRIDVAMWRTLRPKIANSRGGETGKFKNAGHAVWEVFYKNGSSIMVEALRSDLTEAGLWETMPEDYRGPLL